MCGIAGISFSSYHERWSPTEILQILFPAMVHRGPDAFGYMYYDGEQVVYQKFPGRSDDAGVVRSIAIPEDIFWIVLHVRKATHGSPADNRNNHPLRHHSVIGVHNGQIRNHRKILAQTGRYSKGCQVDSEAIFAAVHKWGHKGIRKLEGPMVSVYTHLEEDPWNLRIAKTKDRPLCLAAAPAGGLMFASEPGILATLGFPIDEHYVPDNQLFVVGDGKIQSTSVIKKKSKKFVSGSPITLQEQLYKEHEEEVLTSASSLWRNGDRYRGMYYYEGEWLSEQTFLEVAQLERQMNLDMEE